MVKGVSPSGVGDMSFRDLDPEQFALLAGILDDVCRAAGISQNCPERRDVAALVMQFYACGYRSADELRGALFTFEFLGGFEKRQLLSDNLDAGLDRTVG
jgi:hypothetical protein